MFYYILAICLSTCRSGPMVAVFKYSPVATYSVSLPHKMLDFNSSLRGEFLKEDFKKVVPS